MVVISEKGDDFFIMHGLILVFVYSFTLWNGLVQIENWNSV